MVAPLAADELKASPSRIDSAAVVLVARLCVSAAGYFRKAVYEQTPYILFASAVPKLKTCCSLFTLFIFIIWADIRVF